MAFTIYDADLAPASAETGTSGTMLAFSPTSPVPVGKLAVLLYVGDSTGGVDEENTAHVTVTDTQGNTWTRAAEGQRAAGGPLVAGVFFSLITTEIGTTDTITITSDVDSADRGVTLAAFNVGAGNSVEVAGKGYHILLLGAGVQYSASVSGLTSEEHLWIGTNAHLGGNGNVDSDAAYAAITQGGGALWGNSTASHWAKGGYLVSTGTTETYNGTNNTGGSRQTVAVLVGFKEVAAAGGRPPGGLMRMGVG